MQNYKNCGNASLLDVEEYSLVEEEVPPPELHTLMCQKCEAGGYQRGLCQEGGGAAAYGPGAAKMESPDVVAMERTNWTETMLTSS